MYRHYKSKGSKDVTRDVVNGLVEEINRRYGVVESEAQREKIVRRLKDRGMDFDKEEFPEDDENARKDNNNYRILPDEDSTRVSLLPSDSYAGNLDEANAKSEERQRTVAPSVESYRAFRRFRDIVNRSFRVRVAQGGGDEIIGVNLDRYVDDVKRRLSETPNEMDKLQLLTRGIHSTEGITITQKVENVLYRELVKLPLTLLKCHMKQAEKFVELKNIPDKPTSDFISGKLQQLVDYASNKHCPIEVRFTDDGINFNTQQLKSMSRDMYNLASANLEMFANSSAPNERLRELARDDNGFKCETCPRPPLPATRANLLMSLLRVDMIVLQRETANQVLMTLQIIFARMLRSCWVVPEMLLRV